jgi:hypothetical protein
LFEVRVKWAYPCRLTRKLVLNDLVNPIADN